MAIGRLRRNFLCISSAALVSVAALVWHASQDSRINNVFPLVAFASRRTRTSQEQCRNEDGAERWPLFSQFLGARRVEPSSSDLPPVADVFATGSPCASAVSPRHLRPTVHFVLDLHQPEEGKRIDDNYKRWFPEPTYSVRAYSCLFGNASRTKVVRTRNHDKRLWPSHGDCSQAGRFRSVVLTCTIPSKLARSVLDESQPSLSVQLERRLSDGSLAKTAEIPVQCQLGKDESCKLIARYHPRYREESVGICTMIKEVSGCSLEEWLEYYRFVGVDGAYIFDNSNNGEGERLRQILSPWLNGNFATLLRWPPQGGLWWVSQTKAVNSCLRRFSALHRWMIVSDLDERIVPLQKPENFILSTRAQSLMSYVLQRHVGKLNDAVSSLVVRNWDMHGDSDKSFCKKDGPLLIEQGTTQCQDGPSVDRMKSIFSTDMDENELVDQGHCTVIGLAPSELDPRQEMRMNHYWSNTATQCRKWEPAPHHLLTSSRNFRFLLHKELASTVQVKIPIGMEQNDRS